MLQKFMNKFDGSYTCSGSGRKLTGWCPCVGDSNDEDGYNWRSFDPEFWTENIEGKMSLEEVYATYPAASLAD